MFSKCSNFKSTSQSRSKQDKQIFIEILYLSLKKNIYYPFCFSFLSISSSSIKTLLIHSCESYSGIYIERSISVCHEIMKKRFRVAACLYLIEQRWDQNRVRRSVTHFAVLVINYWTDTGKHGIYLLISFQSRTNTKLITTTVSSYKLSWL